jgi:NADH:ubiquinone reductase (H+-translocating)
VIIVERAGSILGPLPEWMKGYIKRNLRDLDIEVCVESAITSIEADKVVLSNGRSYSNALVIWAAGVKTAGFFEALPFQKNQQGRLFVDECLRVDDACFAVGDAACFRYRDGVLRMGVQFAIAQGLLAAQNIARLIKGLSLKKYKPVDFGYIVPMANNRACGVTLGLNMTGILAIMIHYCMCAYRSYGFSNKVGVLTGLNGGGRI